MTRLLRNRVENAREIGLESPKQGLGSAGVRHVWGLR